MTKNSQVATRYAKAFFGAVIDSKINATGLSKLEKEVASLYEMAVSNDDFSSFLANPSLNEREQSAVVEALIAKAKPHDFIANLLKTLVKNRRLAALADVLAAVLARFADSRNEIVAQVATAKTMSAAQKKDIVSFLEKQTGKTIIVESTVDETLIGGVVIRYGSTLIDNSIKTKLEDMKRQLKGAA